MELHLAGGTRSRSVGCPDGRGLWLAVVNSHRVVCYDDMELCLAVVSHSRSEVRSRSKGPEC